MRLLTRARLAVVTISLMLVGCEALVSDSLPSTIACSGDLPGICPSGQACTNGKCVTACVGAGCHLTFDPDGGADATLHDGHTADTGGDSGHADRTMLHEAAVDAPTPLGALGASCDEVACADGLACVLPNDFGSALDIRTSLCTLACCTDSDCDGGVCYPTAGGNLCITAELASTCSGGSGCGTACCHDGDCAASGSGDKCSLGTTSAGTLMIPSCRPSACAGSGCGSANDMCGRNADCAHGNCGSAQGACEYYGCNCTPTCCNDTDCDSQGRGSCQWGEFVDPQNVTFLVRTCSRPGSTATGTDCTSDVDGGASDCHGGICATFAGGTASVCTQPCCSDADCASIDTGNPWTCAPYSDSLGSNTSIVLLVCQPPVVATR